MKDFINGVVFVVVVMLASLVLVLFFSNLSDKLKSEETLENIEEQITK